MNAGDNNEVYISRSMYAPFDPATIEDKTKVAEYPQTEGYIKRKSYNGLCCMPTEVGASASTNYADYFWTDEKTSKGLLVRSAGGSANDGADAGASAANASGAAAYADSYCSSPLCYFEADPIVEA